MLYSGMYTDGQVETQDTFSVVPNAGTAFYLFDKNKSKNNLLTHHINMYYDASLNHAWHVSVVMDYISKSSDTNSKKVLCNRKFLIRSVNIHTIISFIMIVSMISINCKHRKCTYKLYTLS